MNDSEMKWFAAHVIMRLQVNGEPDIPLLENIFLVKAVSHGAAKVLAEGLAKAGDVSNLSYNGKDATWEFAGVRQTMLCQDYDLELPHGEEITYLELRVKDESDLEKLLAGESVSLVFDG